MKWFTRRAAPPPAIESVVCADCRHVIEKASAQCVHAGPYVNSYLWYCHEHRKPYDEVQVWYCEDTPQRRAYFKHRVQVSKDGIPFGYVPVVPQ